MENTDNTSVVENLHICEEQVMADSDHIDVTSDLARFVQMTCKDSAAYIGQLQSLLQEEKARNEFLMKKLDGNDFHRAGEWIETGYTMSNNGGNYRCSVCGRLSAYKEPFCHCGARMKQAG